MTDGLHAEIIAPYFQHMRLLLVEGLALGDLSDAKLIKFLGGLNLDLCLELINNIYYL